MSISQDIKVDIKPHPRDFDINKIANQYGFDIIEKTSLFSEYITKYDLAIARASSIVKDIFLSRIPFLTALFSEQDQNTKNQFISPNFIIEYKRLYIFDEGSLKNSINNPEEIYKVCNLF